MSTHPQRRHDLYEEWLELELDGRLAPEQQALLAAHARDCAACGAARVAQARLGALLSATAVEVAPGFRDRVLAALPAAGWESRHPRSWRLPLAAFAVLGGLGAALVGMSSAHLEGGSVLGALLALGGLVRAAALAGAGLLGASWKGVGLGVRELFASPLNLGVFGVLVLCLDLLLVSMVRRRRAAGRLAAPAAAGRRVRSERSGRRAGAG
jgi:hypothetical protein